MNMPRLYTTAAEPRYRLICQCGTPAETHRINKPKRERSVKHPQIRWNPELQEWFCVRCGLTSDHIRKENAETELEFFECRLPTAKLLAGAAE